MTMTNNEVVQQMIQAFTHGDDKAFKNAAIDYIEITKRKNHHILARELERILARANGSAGFAQSQLDLTPRGYGQIPQDKNRAADLLEIREPDQDIEELILSRSTREALIRVSEEVRHGEILRSHGMRPINKLLLYGPPGCGKTVAAEALAKRLYLPFALVRFDALISSYLGDTAANLRQVFDFARLQPVVLFFDEFDAVGKRRDDREEHGELKRVVNSFLQMLDGFHSESIIITATNHEGMLDPALWRRFDEIVAFPRPNAKAVEETLRKNLRQQRLSPNIDLGDAAEQLAAIPHISHADAERVAHDAIKSAILNNESPINKVTFTKALKKMKERLAAVQNIL